MIAPGQGGSAAAAPAAPQRIASLTPSFDAIAPTLSIARGSKLPGLGAIAAPRTGAADGDVLAAPGAVDASAHRAGAPAAPMQVAAQTDMNALRALIAAQTGGVPLPFARAARAATPEATPVERLDLAAAEAAPARRLTAGTAQPGLGARDGVPTATPITRLDAPTGAAAAAAPVVLGPGRLDDRRASSLVAAISTRPGWQVSAPRFVTAPGLSQTPGGRTDQAQGGVYGSQASAPRPTFGAAAPSLGTAGAPLPEDAPLVVASRGGGMVASRGSDAPQLARPRLAALPRVGAPGRGQPFFQSAPDTDAPRPDVAAAEAAGESPLLALVLHGVDPALAVDPAGPLAPLLAAGAPITLVVPQAWIVDLAVGPQLRAMGVDLVIEAAPSADLSAIVALGAVAVSPVSGDEHSISMSALRRFLSGMRNHGLALFNPAPSGGATARMAMNMGLEVVASQQRVEIRSEANLAVLRSSLDRAAFGARQGGGAAIELHAAPATIAEAAAWFTGAGAATASPATVSALLIQRRTR